MASFHLIIQRPISIISIQDPYESSQSRGHDVAPDTTIVHTGDDVVYKDVRSDRGWSRPHSILDFRFRVAVERFAAYAAKYNLFVIEHNAHVLTSRRNLPSYVSESVPKGTCRNVLPNNIDDPCRLPLSGQSTDRSVRFAIEIIVDLCKAEGFESPRGSWAQVSQHVVTVDDHRAVPIEIGDRTSVQFREWDIDSSWEVVLLVVIYRQDIQ